MKKLNKYKKDAEDLINYCKKNDLIIIFWDRGKVWKYSKGWLSKTYQRDSKLTTIKTYNVLKKRNEDWRRLKSKDLIKYCEPEKTKEKKNTKRWLIIDETRKIQNGVYKKYEK